MARCPECGKTGWKSGLCGECGTVHAARVDRTRRDLRRELSALQASSDLSELVCHYGEIVRVVEEWRGRRRRGVPAPFDPAALQRLAREKRDYTALRILRAEARRASLRSGAGLGESSFEEAVARVRAWEPPPAVTRELERLERESSRPLRVVPRAAPIPPRSETASTPARGSDEGGAERRRAPRRKAQFFVQMHPGGARALAEDVSASGLFLHCPQAPTPGSVLRLVLHTSTGIIPVEGVVRWVRHTRPAHLPHVRAGVGLEFRVPPAALARHLGGGARAGVSRDALAPSVTRESALAAG